MLQVQPAVTTFPEITGRNLNDVAYNLPADFEGAFNVVFLVFHLPQQALVNTWLPYADALAGRFSDLHVYELPTLTQRDGLFRTYIDSGMRSGIPDQEGRARTITLYLDRPRFLRGLGLVSDQTIYTLLVVPSGEILWMAEGAYSQAKATDLELRLEASVR